MVQSVDKRGLKRVCEDCGARFYDLGKRPIICPACSTEFTGLVKVKSKRGRPAKDTAAAKPAPVKKKVAPVKDREEEIAEEEEEEEEEDIVSLDDLEEGSTHDDDDDGAVKLDIDDKDDDDDDSDDDDDEVDLKELGDLPDVDEDEELTEEDIKGS